MKALLTIIKANKLKSNSVVVILGQGGSGKSTLANLIQLKLGYFALNFDSIAYKSGWVNRTYAEFSALFAERFSQMPTSNGRVLEGIYIDAHDPEKSRQRLINKLIDDKIVTHVIWIHEPRWLRMFRLAKRSFLRSLNLAPQGVCPEKWKNVKELLWKTWSTNDETVQLMDESWQKWQHQAFIYTVNCFTLFGQCRMLTFEKN